jgi:hypothetical protein
VLFRSAGIASTQFLGSWFWPGRIFFDGIQHRWNKWVLDYSADDQVGIFSRLFGSQTARRSVSTPTGGGERGPSPWGAIVLVVVAAIGYLWARKGSGTFDPSTRMYLQLRAASSRAGLGITPGLTPLALVSRIREKRSTAGAAAERVVDLYLRDRYGNQALGDSDVHEMQEALRAARRTLRAKA